MTQEETTKSESPAPNGWHITAHALEDGITRTHGDLEARFKEMLAEGRKVRLFIAEKTAPKNE
ncbi:MAG: hypothetical protein ABSD89_13670 [Halobacteriota archaeon]|jgi:hypothetical protein